MCNFERIDTARHPSIRTSLLAIDSIQLYTSMDICGLHKLLQGGGLALLQKKPVLALDLCVL